LNEREVAKVATNDRIDIAEGMRLMGGAAEVGHASQLEHLVYHDANSAGDEMKSTARICMRLDQRVPDPDTMRG
jgi:hypothetical protein